MVHLHKTSTRSSQSTSQPGYGRGLTSPILAGAVLALERGFWEVSFSIMDVTAEKWPMFWQMALYLCMWHWLNSVVRKRRRKTWMSAGKILWELWGGEKEDWGCTWLLLKFLPWERQSHVYTSSQGPRDKPGHSSTKVHSEEPVDLFSHLIDSKWGVIYRWLLLVLENSHSHHYQYTCVHMCVCEISEMTLLDSKKTMLYINQLTYFHLHRKYIEYDFLCSHFT